MDIKIHKADLNNNPLLVDLNNKLTMLGYFKETDMRFNYFKNVDNNLFSYQEMLDFHLIGVDFQKYVFYVYADSTVLDSQVHENLPNRINSEEEIKTYADWVYSVQTSLDETKILFPAGTNQYIVDLTLIQYLPGTIIRLTEVNQIVNSESWNSEQNVAVTNPIQEISNTSFLFNDYKAMRAEMKTVTNTIGWDNLTDIDKDIVADNFINIQWTISRLGFGTALYNIKSKLFDLKSQQAREIRFNKLRQAVANLMPRINAHEVAEVLISKNLYTSYVLSGIEGTVKTDITGLNDPVGIYDYILSTIGTEYENIGISSMSFTSNNGLTATEFANYLINILDNG